MSLAFFDWASSVDGTAVAVTRLALIVVLLWIGGLKAAKYEADSIVPFVANSPFMRSFYADRRQYRAHMNRKERWRRPTARGIRRTARPPLRTHSDS